MKWYGLFGLFLVGLPIVLGVVILQVTSTKLDCQTQFGPCSPEITALFQPLVGQSLLAPTFSLTHPQIAKYTTHVVWPSTTQVQVALQTFVGQVIDAANQSHIITSHGLITPATSSSSALPTLFFDNILTPGSTIAPSVQTALQLLAGTPSSKPIQGHMVKNVLAYNVNLILILADVDKPSWDTLTSLQAVLARSKINSQIPKKIDLRYQNPIVVY